MWFAAVRADEQRYNENDDALELNIKAVRMHPDWPTARQNMVQQLMGLGRLDEAIAWAMRGKELSTDPMAGATLFFPYLEFGDLDRARNSMSDIPVEHPLYVLGEGADRLLNLDFHGAAEAFENVVQNTDNPRQFMFGLIAGSAVLAGDYEKARQYAELDNPEFTADAEATGNWEALRALTDSS